MGKQPNEGLGSIFDRFQQYQRQDAAELCHVGNDNGTGLNQPREFVRMG